MCIYIGMYIYWHANIQTISGSPNESHAWPLSCCSPSMALQSVHVCTVCMYSACMYSMYVHCMYVQCTACMYSACMYSMYVQCMYVQSISFGVSFLHSQISIDNLVLLYHVPLKRTQLDSDWRLIFNDTPNATGCVFIGTQTHIQFLESKRISHIATKLLFARDGLEKRACIYVKTHKTLQILASSYETHKLPLSCCWHSMAVKGACGKISARKHS